jgi:DNA-binding CsgD family transcriptional regulator
VVNSAYRRSGATCPLIRGFDFAQPLLRTNGAGERDGRHAQRRRRLAIGEAQQAGIRRPAPSVGPDRGMDMYMSEIRSSGAEAIADSIHRVTSLMQEALFHIPHTEYQNFVLEVIRAHIPFDSAAWWNPKTGLYLINQDSLNIARFVMHYADQDLVRVAASASPGQAFRIEDTMSDYRSRPIYLELGKSIGIEQALGMILVDPATHFEDYFVLWRARADTPFSDSERTDLPAYARAMVTAWGQRQALDQMMRAAEGTRQYALVTNNGIITAAGAGFSERLTELFGDGDGQDMPPTLCALLGKGDGCTKIGDGNIRTASIGEFRIISIGPATQPSSLSTAEMRTALLFAAGSDYKSIAAQLGLSTHTVRNQISSAYRKLGVHSKMGLAEAIKYRI